MSGTIAKKFTKAHDSVAGLRFLVVDDHKFSRHIVVDALKWLDATKITEASDAEEAIRVIQGAASYDRKSLSSESLAKRLELSDDRIFGQGTFDCIITDFNMSPMNGLHLLAAVRTGVAKCARDTPVLMLTGFSDDHLISAALELDVSAFVLKPVSRDTFNEKLSRVLMRPIELQDAKVYARVAIPDCGGPTGTADSAAQEDQGQQTKQALEPDFEDRELQVVKVAEIADNSILAEDIVLGENIEGPNGAILIHSGTRLTAVLLEKLRELDEIGMLPDSLKIVV